MDKYDSWKLHTPDDDLVFYCYCDHCGGEIYIGDEYLYIQLTGDSVHEDCLEQHLVSIIETEKFMAG